jgi:hypothetical protein
MKKVLLICGLALGAGVAAGQPAPAPTSQPAAAPLPGVQLEKREEMSTSDMTDRTRKRIEKMNESLKHVVGLQEIARKQKDVIKLNCVNDKLLQVKQLLNIADAASTNMQEAIARRDEDSRYHEYGRVNIAAQQTQSLATESENCIGEELTFLGPTQVTVEEPELPEDPDHGPPFPAVEPLPVASPKL